MNDEEFSDMINDSKEEKILERTQVTIELFFDNEGKISDTDLARLVSLQGIETSSSTAGRDLTSERAVRLIGEERVNIIKELRAKNKLEGKIKGGKNSVSNNDVLRDENGKFQGSHKRFS